MDKVRYGVIGLGMGRAHISGMREIMNADLTAVCDINEGRLADCLKSYPEAAG